MKKWLAVFTIFMLAGALFAGTAMANGTLTATFLYNGSGIDQPLDHAYIYLQSAQLSPREKYFKNAQYVFGPTNSSGYISASVPNGTYHVRLTRRAPLGTAPTQSQAYGPPNNGDYTWNYTGATITVNTGSVINLGTVYAALFNKPITISGRVTSLQYGTPISGWFVMATAQPCVIVPDYNNYSAQGECPGVKYAAQLPTDSNGNYSIKIRTPGTYYVYIMNRPGRQGYLPTASCTTCEWWGGSGLFNCGYSTPGNDGNGDFWYPYCPISVSSGNQLTVNIAWQ